MFAASLRTASLHTGLLVSVLFLMTVGSCASAANQKAFKSSLVRSNIVMHSGVRQVQPLQTGEELDDDEDVSTMDDDTPSLMQAEISTKRSTSKLLVLDELETNDETSMMQTVLALHKVQPHASYKDGSEDEEEEEEEFSALQTSVTMMVGNRHLGTGRPPDEDEDTFDGASFMQNEATFVSKTERTDTCCTNGQLEGTYDDDATDEVSLMQTDIVLNQALVLDELDTNDETSMMQTILALHKVQPHAPDKDGSEDDEEEEEEFSAIQTSVTMMVGNRHLGTGRQPDEDEDTFDGASFMQNEATFVSKSERTDTGCTNGQLEGTYDEDATDEVSLMQTDIVLNQAESQEGHDYGIEEEEEFSAMQTSVTMMVRERRGHHYGEEEDEDEDAFDGSSFMQNEATYMKKGSRIDASCTDAEADGPEDEEASDEVSL